MRRILCLSCSPRKGGNTDFCTELIAGEIRKAPGVEVAIARLDDYDIRHCLGCRRCMELKDCVIRDDDFHKLWDRIAAADVVIQASCVYWLGPPGKHKDLIDRSHAFYARGRGVLAGKSAYTVSVAAEFGFQQHEACVECWLDWYGAEVKGRIRVKARELGDAKASSATIAELKRFAAQIAAAEADW